MTEMIGRLRVALGLETAAFEKGAKRAAAEIDTFGSKAEKAGFKVGTMGKAIVAGGVALAGSAIVGQIKDMVMAGLEYASALGEQAQQLGVTTKAMQEYRYVASQTGVSNEEMDAALAKLNRTLGDAATGNKKAQSAFDALGISVRDSNGHVKDAGALIPEIAGALEKVGSPAERASLLVDLFGKSGQKLAPLMAEGAGGVNKLREEAHKLGQVLSDEQIQKADATADKITALNDSFNKRVAGVVADNADSILALVDALSALLEKLLKLVEVGAKLANSPIGRLIGTGIGASGNLGLSPEVMDAIKAAEGGKSTGGAAPVKATPTTSWGKTSTAPMLGRSGGSVYRGPVTNFAGGGILPSAAGTFASQAAGNGPSMEDRIWDQSDALAKVQGVLAEEAVQTADKVETSNVRIAKSFGDMAQESLNALQSLASAVRGGGFLDILGAVIGMGLQLGSVGAFGKSFQTKVNAPRIPAYAGGTSFHPGGLAMVGERGPEVVRLPRGSAVYPNGTGPSGRTAIQVLPSKYFDVHVANGIGAAAPMIAQAGGELGFRKTVNSGRRRLA